MNKEQVYDERINPLMAQIIEICQGAGISMLAHFEIPTEEDPHLVCTTSLPDGEGNRSSAMRKAHNAALGRGSFVALAITGERG